MSRIRCFVAAALPGEVRAALVGVQERLREAGADLRWVAPGAMHLTLKFIGEVDPEVFAAIEGALDAPIPCPGGATLVPRGVGAFPSPARARVAWAGLSGDVGAVARAALQVEARLEPLGIPREKRPFAPHLTLGRARSQAGAADLRRALEAEQEFEGPAFAVPELVLYESRLSPKGPTYLARKTVKLG